MPEGPAADGQFMAGAVEVIVENMKEADVMSGIEGHGSFLQDLA